MHAQVEVQDVTNVTCCFTLAGPGSDAIVAQLGAERLAMQSHGTHALFGSRSGQPIVVSVGSGLHHAGYTLISGQNVAADVWQQLVKLVRPGHCHGACAGHCSHTGIEQGIT